MSKKKSQRSGATGSGDPAVRASAELTVKQQRAEQRREKVAAYQRQQARDRLWRRIWSVVGSVAAAAVVVAIVVTVVLTPRAPSVSYEAGGSTGAVIDGVETFTNTSEHVEGTVDYPQSPPAGGPHNPVWLTCDVYTEPQVTENAVHSMEHGAVWVTYDAARVDDAELTALRGQLPSSYVILSPFEGLERPIVLSAWNAQLQLDSADDPRIAKFFTEYWRSQFAPEPNATCSGGVVGPGRA
ncbi:MAG: DUF3105 domain-containing protein [Propionicimonas sp.]|nr:DUF3105 domain-containing protein [Propionicimonas sp.]